MFKWLTKKKKKRVDTSRLKTNDPFLNDYGFVLRLGEDFNKWYETREFWYEKMSRLN